MSSIDEASTNDHSQEWDHGSEEDFYDSLAFYDFLAQEYEDDEYLNYEDSYMDQYDDYWGDDQIRYDNVRQYRVIRPTHLTLETISFHIGRATGFAIEHNRTHEIGLLVRLLARTFKEYDAPTRRELMKAIFAFFTMDECSDSIIQQILYILFEERGMNFKLMCEVLDVLDENSYRQCVFLCALEWSTSGRRNQKHATQLRYFTEMLDEAQMEKYFKSFSVWSDDEEYTKFLITKVFYDWVHDYNFQANLFAWLFDHRFIRSFRYFSSTYGFYRDVILEGIPYVCATSRHSSERLHHMWTMMCDDYDLHDEIINIVFEFIELLPVDSETTYTTNWNWTDVVNVLFPIVKEQLSHKDFRLFLCEVMRRLMGKNNSELVRMMNRLYFSHLSAVRQLVICLNWCNFDATMPYYTLYLFQQMTRAEMDTVFLAVCAENNVPAANWIKSRQLTARYTLNVVDGKIVSYGIVEEALDLSFLSVALESPLCRFGFKAKDSRTLKNKNDECVVCMEPLESTVVLNCHPTHQICEGCCDRMMRMNLKSTCPLCRGSVRPSDCSVYV